MDETTQAPSRNPGGPSGGWTLVVVGPGLLRTLVPAPGATLIIGREAGCDVRLDHARISRRHAELHVGETCGIKDLGSRNGTIVRGTPVPAGRTARLSAGESFSLGPFTLILVNEAAAAPAPSSMIVDEPAPATPTALLVTVAKSPLTVLIRGETGVGKEVLAETLHRLSGRRGQLLKLNCAAFGAELLESELFGHERGAFTGAVAAKPGLLEVGHGGTVFLDEIGELPPPLQAKLLRAIEAREVIRVGGTKVQSVDVRFIAATNRDLHVEIARGQFRLDLYYRLAVLTLSLPALRERPARIPMLAHEIAAAAAERSGFPAPRIAPAAMARLQAHTWPGNVRELRNTLERAIVLAAGGPIGAQHIVIDAPSGDPAAPAASPFTAATDRDERARIIAALDQCAGNQTRAARLLGISRATLVNKLALLKIPRPRGR